MPEISHVRLEVPEQASLHRLLREAGTAAFPQWLAAEPGPEARIAWWGVRGAALQLLEIPDDPARMRLFPRAVDDWSEPPRGLVLATLDAERAAAELAPALGGEWRDADVDDVLGAACRRMTLGRSVLVLAEPITEGYVAACLARHGEGPVAVALEASPGTVVIGQQVPASPVGDAPATWVRIGPGTAPYLLLVRDR